MSKFLKVIVNLFLVFAILVAGAILIPPILGVSTTMIDSASMDTNLPVGSITYSQTESVSNVLVGDKILIENDNSVYVYVVESVDAVSGQFVVSDAIDSQMEEEEIVLRNEVLKVVLTVPLIGYIMVAMHSMEGLIIIGLVVLFVIILFILSELWKKSDDDELEDELEEENGAFGVNVVKADIEVADAEVSNMEVSNIEASNIEAADHELADIEDGAVKGTEAEESDVKVSDAESFDAEAAEIKETETEVSGTDVLEGTEDVVADAVEELEAETSEAAEEVEEENKNTFEKVPRPTLDEILVKAETEGEQPEIISYDTFGITIVDFTKCI